MTVNLENMTYKEFKEFCTERSQDGKWSMLEAMACLQVIDEIDSIKVKGLFSRRKTRQAREEEWKRRGYKTLS